MSKAGAPRTLCKTRYGSVIDGSGIDDKAKVVEHDLIALELSAAREFALPVFYVLEFSPDYNADWLGLSSKGFVRHDGGHPVL